MHYGFARLNCGGVSQVNSVKFFEDNQKLSFILKTKNVYKKKASVCVEYYADDALKVYNKMCNSDTYVIAHGDVVNHSRNQSLIFLAREILVLGEINDDNIEKVMLSEQENSYGEDFNE